MTRTLALALFLLACGTPADQPEALVYDTRACAACGMLVSDARYAAQLITKEGERLTFDDPACAFHWVADHGPSLSHLWFRDATQQTDVWLDWQQVAFQPATGAPMDGGFAAVPVGTPGALSFSAASNAILGKRR